MPKSKRKNRLNTTIDKDLLKQFKILAVQEDKRLNQLLEDSFRGLLAKYESKPGMATKSPTPKQKKREQEEPDPNSLSLQGIKTTLQEMVKELKETRRAVEKSPKKVSSVIPALTGLVVGLILAGVFFTANYSGLLTPSPITLALGLLFVVPYSSLYAPKGGSNGKVSGKEPL